MATVYCTDTSGTDITPKCSLYNPYYNGNTNPTGWYYYLIKNNGTYQQINISVKTQLTSALTVYFCMIGPGGLGGSPGSSYHLMYSDNYFPEPNNGDKQNGNAGAYYPIPAGSGGGGGGGQVYLCSNTIQPSITQTGTACGLNSVTTNYTVLLYSISAPSASVLVLPDNSKYYAAPGSKGSVGGNSSSTASGNGGTGGNGGTNGTTGALGGAGGYGGTGGEAFYTGVYQENGWNDTYVNTKITTAGTTGKSGACYNTATAPPNAYVPNVKFADGLTANLANAGASQTAGNCSSILVYFKY